MHDLPYHPVDRAAATRRSLDADDPALACGPEPTAFPVFTEPPFFAWQNLHRKHELFNSLHPSCQPLILLWDELDEPELLL